MATHVRSESNARMAWLESNPLRQWRLRQPPEGWRRSVLARALNVSHSAVAKWEHGANLPVVDSFLKIEELTGISARAWVDWHARKPLVDGPEGEPGEVLIDEFASREAPPPMIGT